MSAEAKTDIAARRAARTAAAAPQSAPPGSSPPTAIVPAAARKVTQQAAQAAAAAAAPPPAVAQANRLKAQEDRFDKVIKRWMNAQGSSDPIAKETSVTIPLAVLTGSTVLDQWRAQYQNAGYVVTMDSKKFTVALP